MNIIKRGGGVTLRKTEARQREIKIKSLCIRYELKSIKYIHTHTHTPTHVMRTQL